MCLSRARWAGGAALLLVLALTPSVAGQTALARLTYVENEVEARGASDWKSAIEGGGFDIGEQLRTGSDGVARLELPWMALSVSPDSVVRLPDEFFLSVVLEKGRAVLEAETHESLKLVTAEGEVRGQGRAIVRREGRRTLVTCVTGRFLVEAGGRGVTLEPGRGTIVAAGRAPAPPEDTPPPPAEEALWPGLDPVYAEPGETLDLAWEADAPAFQIEILPVGLDYVLYQRDVGPPPYRVKIPWSGAFRWRVASRDARGLEGVPSREGLICIDLVQ